MKSILQYLKPIFWGIITATMFIGDFIFEMKTGEPVSIRSWVMTITMVIMTYLSIVRVKQDIIIEKLDELKKEKQTNPN